MLVATPGRLIDLLNQKLGKLKRYLFLCVLDEANGCWIWAFCTMWRGLIKEYPRSPSDHAVFGNDARGVEMLTKQILKDPVFVAVTPVSSTVESVGQYVYHVNKSK